MGNVNNYEAPPAPIMGLAAAIGAVRNLYGISTDKAEAALKNSQVALQGADLKGKQISNDAAQFALDQNRQAMGIINGSSGGDGSNASVVPGPGGSASPLQSFAGDSDKAKYLRTHMPMSPYANAFAEGVDKNAKLDNDLLETKSKQAGINKTNQDIAMVPVEEKTKLGNEFDKVAQPLQAKIGGYQAIAQALTSGNVASVNPSIMKLSLDQEDTKRMSELGLKLGESPKWSDVINDMLAKKKTGLPDPAALQRYIGAANQGQLAAVTQLNTIADQASSRFSQTHKADRNAVRSFLLPNGDGAAYMVPDKKSGKYMLHVKVGNGWAPAGGGLP